MDPFTWSAGVLEEGSGVDPLCLSRGTASTLEGWGSVRWERCEGKRQWWWQPPQWNNSLQNALSSRPERVFLSPLCVSINALQ